MEITIENKHLALINIYGPNTEYTYILEQLIKYLSNNTDKYFIIAGYFNTILDTDLDKNGGIKNTHPKCRNLLLEIIKGGVSLPLLELRVSSFRLNVMFGTYKH